MTGIISRGGSRRLDIPTHYDDAVQGVEETESTEQSFPDKIKDRIIKDFAQASEDRKSVHRWYADMHAFYNRAQDYEDNDLKRDKKFPVTTIQEDIDTFVADARDKVTSTGRPCNIIGREEKDKADAAAKQGHLDFQDEQDGIFNKIGVALHDGSLYSIIAAQVDYAEKTRREWMQKDVPVPLAQEDEDGQPILDEDGERIPILDENNQLIPTFDIDGQPIMEKEFVLEDVIYYRGSTVKRIDPGSLFFCKEKKEVSDSHPLMIRDYVTKDFFRGQGKDYFFGFEGLESPKEGTALTINDDISESKTNRTNPNDTTRGTRNPYEYIEWHAPVDKAELYEWLIENRGMKERERATIRPGEKVWAIGGLVNGETVVQLREEPFRWDKPNIIVGYISPDEKGLSGIGIAQKIEHVQRASEDIMGMIMEAMRQSVNPFWVVNMNHVVDKKNAKVNEAGGILQTNGSVRDVAQRYDMGQIAPDLFTLLGLFKNMSQDEGGVQPNLQGKGDVNAETLGESTAALAHASIRMRDYLRTFENSFLIPLYELRNHINATFIDTEYSYRVLGEKGLEWRQIQPGQMRAPVDFICESSTRETNRAIIIQQMLQFIQIAPVAQQIGQPVRLDKMLAELAEKGFSWPRAKILEFFPLLRLEEDGQFDVDQHLVQNAALKMQLDGLMAAAGIAQLGGGGAGLGAGPGSPQEQIPQPGSEGEAIESNQARNQPAVRSVQ